MTPEEKARVKIDGMFAEAGWKVVDRDHYAPNMSAVAIKEGLLKTHLYIEEINSLECDRFRIDGIDVYAEAFGSMDIFNLYNFTYEDFDIKELGDNLNEEDLIALYNNELK